MASHSERDFETAIEAELIGSGGYPARSHSAYDETLALFRRRHRLPACKTANRPNGRRWRHCSVQRPLPPSTAELKNPLTGQRAADAIRQYQQERDARDLLFAFKKRALVHFAVDPDEVWMTTRLNGKDTHFLPFNRSHAKGAGNPPVEGHSRLQLEPRALSQPACHHRGLASAGH
ncbi:MAG: hypothetical protein ACOC26_00580, partial [Halochromatium sp.]